MLIVMAAKASESEIQLVMDKILDLGLQPLPVPGANRTAICVTGNDGALEEGMFSRLPGVKEIIRVTKNYKLTSREVQPQDTVVDIDGVKIGGDCDPVIMSGPCSVESESQTLKIAEGIQKAGLKIFRAGAFKPRTSPYSFQGMGVEGLKILKKVREETGLKVVSEIMDTEMVSVMAEYVDMMQVGTRNMQNFSLLKSLGALNKPVLLKRGMSASLDEWLNAAEYLLKEGNSQVVLCERGIRSHSTHTRNTLDLNVVPHVRKLSHLPIVVDPSHGVGVRELVRPMSRAAIACGAQGLIIESHFDPNQAVSDQAQTITLETLKEIIKDTERLSQLTPLSYDV